MKAAVFDGPEKLSIQQIPDPVAGPNDVVVDVVDCGICGSDLHSYLEGAFIAPGQVMGHEFSGKIVEIGKDVQGVKIGDRVTAVPLSTCGRCPRCLEGATHLCEIGLAESVAYGLPGAFAEFVRIPNVVLGGNLYKIPDNVDDAAGALVEPLAVALHAAKMSAPGPSDTCVVLGLGSIGLVARAGGDRHLLPKLVALRLELRDVEASAQVRVGVQQLAKQLQCLLAHVRRALIKQPFQCLFGHLEVLLERQHRRGAEDRERRALRHLEVAQRAQGVECSPAHGGDRVGRAIEQHLQQLGRRRLRTHLFCLGVRGAAHPQPRELHE